MSLGPDAMHPAGYMFLIARSDDTAISPVPRSVRFDEAGTVVLRAVNSAADVTLTVAAGEVLPVRVQFIRLTGSDDIVMHGLA